MLDKCGKAPSRSVEDDVFDLLSYALFKRVSQQLVVTGALVHFLASQPGCRAESNDARHTLRSRSSLSLLMTANILGRQPDTATNEKGARPFGGVKLMSGIDNRSTPECPRQSEFGRGLHGIGVQPGYRVPETAPRAPAQHLFDWRNGTISFGQHHEIRTV